MNRVEKEKANIAGHDVNYLGYAGVLDQIGAAGHPPTIPVKLNQTPGSLRSPPVQFGENTEEILKQMGYPNEEIEKFKHKGVV